MKTKESSFLLGVSHNSDTESKDVANAAHALTHVAYETIVQSGAENGNLLKAGMLARKAILIKERNHGRDNIHTIHQLDNLRDILQ